MNQRPSGYEPDELPLLHPASNGSQPGTYKFNAYGADCHPAIEAGISLQPPDIEVYAPECGSSPRPISTARLNPLRDLHLRPIKQVVYLWPYSFRGRMGDLVLGRASRLYAFSAYPHQTWLPGAAPGGTTGTPVVCPSRSSRTRESFPQISCARDG